MNTADLKAIREHAAKLALDYLERHIVFDAPSSEMNKARLERKFPEAKRHELPRLCAHWAIMEAIEEHTYDAGVDAENVSEREWNDFERNRPDRLTYEQVA
jgi:hypothetical protein